MRHSWLNLRNYLPLEIRITPGLIWVMLYSTIHFHYGCKSLKYFAVSYMMKKWKSHSSMLQTVENFSWEVKREYNSDVTKKNKHLEETYPVLLLNEEANRLV